METSHIWLGLFGRTAPDSYFVEEFNDNDDHPLSTFAAEQGEKWYDHDWVEISFPDEPMDVRFLVAMHSYSKSYVDLVVEKAAKLGINEANVFVLADKAEFSSPRTVSGHDYKLWYLGEFACDTAS